MTIFNMELEIIQQNIPHIHGHIVTLKDETGDVKITVSVSYNDPDCDLRASAIAEVIKDYLNNKDKFLRRKENVR